MNMNMNVPIYVIIDFNLFLLLFIKHYMVLLQTTSQNCTIHTHQQDTSGQNTVVSLFSGSTQNLVNQHLVVMAQKNEMILLTTSDAL